MAVTEAIAPRVLALPMHSDLDEATQARIAAAVKDFVRAGGARGPRAA
jgi:dTDP-4-amino-4,6-dideoxygalactose transaminase